MLKSFFNWKVLLNIVLAGGIFVGLIYLTFRWLEQHTNHGEEIPVPNIMNMPVQEAIKVLEDAGLEYEVDSGEFQPKYKPLQVLQIWPSAGSRVKAHRAIQIRVNPKTWAKVTIPDILDRYKGLAFRQLEQVGLKVGDTIYEPNIQRDAVIRMQMNGNPIKPGIQVPRFSIVDLVIGTGPKRDVPVPNLVGLTVAEAEKVIAQNLFEIGVIEHEDGQNDKTDIVYYQDPQAGSLRDQGMQIDLWASKKAPAQLMNKINELNSIYRMKVEEPTGTVGIEDDFYSSPSADIPPAVATPPKKVEKPAEKPKSSTEQKIKKEENVKKENPAPKKEVTKKEEKKEEKKKEEPKKQTNKTEEKNKKTTENKGKEEKPKAKKVVIE